MFNAHSSIFNAHSLKGGAIVLLMVATVASTAVAAKPDAWITTKAKLALLTTEGVSASSINVDTVNGQITLHGKVGSAAEKEKAASVVAGIEGAQGVRNLLQIVAPKREEPVQLSDDQITHRVEKALKANKSLSGISVQSVNNGVVLLGGKAERLTDHLSAVEIAASVPGVRRVASEIQSPDQLADAEIWQERKTEKSSDGITGAARDMWTTSAVKMRLLADSKTPALNINVDTTGGVVTLFGIVPSREAKAAAEADARKVSRVKTVRNELQVVPKAAQDSVKARDEDLERELKTAFESREGLKDIHITVKNGVVQLTGNVPSGPDRLEAAVVARSTQGVRSVNDHLQVTD